MFGGPFPGTPEPLPAAAVTGGRTGQGSVCCFCGSRRRSRAPGCPHRPPGAREGAERAGAGRVESDVTRVPALWGSWGLSLEEPPVTPPSCQGQVWCERAESDPTVITQTQCWATSHQPHREKASLSETMAKKEKGHANLSASVTGCPDTATSTCPLEPVAF